MRGRGPGERGWGWALCGWGHKSCGWGPVGGAWWGSGFFTQGRGEAFAWVGSTTVPGDEVVQLGVHVGGVLVSAPAVAYSTCVGSGVLVGGVRRPRGRGHGPAWVGLGCVSRATRGPPLALVGARVLRARNPRISWLGSGFQGGEPSEVRLHAVRGLRGWGQAAAWAGSGFACAGLGIRGARSYRGVGGGQKAAWTRVGVRAGGAFAFGPVFPQVRSRAYVGGVRVRAGSVLAGEAGGGMLSRAALEAWRS